eukprot:CAMPEP_0170748348 /NCGR_PEP_ID=MMETSP0437-20130122/9805_1 /TAXON_ID=0 /ORGANISM="Sexangularia sp." /LENGTH=424 /DNA_ID=CAMNT_0011087181 /DNA_START=101 /DNA_END=1372 /DNA_ORIENTATION=-
MSSSVTAEQSEEQINQEYKIWKKNAPFLYDLVMTHAIEWPSLTLCWLPDKEAEADRDYSTSRIILGTHTSGTEQNHLLLAQVRLPLASALVSARGYADDATPAGGFGAIAEKIEVVQKINHPTEVNRARYCPANPSVIATKASSGVVYLWDYTKHASTPTSDGTCNPQASLTGCDADGFALSWNALASELVASGSDDGSLCVWNVSSLSPQDTQNHSPLHKASAAHGAAKAVEDVAFHPHHSHLLGSTGDDGRLAIWDLRQGLGGSPAYETVAHPGDANSLSFNPFSEFVLATGGSDSEVALFDMRKLGKRLHSFQGHTDAVYRVEWSPFSEFALASAANDRRVHLWDIDRIGAEQTEEDAEDGPPELLFVHGGHTAPVSDFGWSPNDPWVLASTAEDNIVQVWQLASNIYGTEDDEGAAAAVE